MKVRLRGLPPPELLALAAIPFVFLVLPLVALAWRTGASGGVWRSLHDPLVIQALWLSLLTTLTTLVVSVTLGTPLAYLLARHRLPGHAWIDTLLDIPIVLPPAVAGVALLVTFGRRGVLGGLLDGLGLEVAFTAAAVVLAQTFVSMPLYVRAARAGFEGVNPLLEDVAASLGESPRGVFRRVTVPLALPSLLAGAVMTWARALGEFGATLMFAGNLPGRTQTIPLAILTAFEVDLASMLTLSCLLLVFSFTALLVFRQVTARANGGSR